MVVVHDMRPKQVIEGFCEEIAVFEVAEHQQVIDDGRDQPNKFDPLRFGIMDQKSDAVVDHGRAQQQHKKETAGLVVEEDAGNEQERIAREAIGVNDGENTQDNRIESPEEKLREEQRGLEIQSKYVA
jgi:hypothetical protein